MAHGKIEKRGQRRRKIKPVILIVTEGSQTEPKYFEHYRNRQTNIDEFYDVVVFAYLKAVKDYFNSPSAQKFSFSTIATRQMKFRLYDYFRTQERRKRNMEVLSIHVGLYPDGAPLEDTIPAHDPIMQQLEMDLLLHELAGRVSKQQMDIVHLKQGGYGLREIARTQKVPMRRIKELLAEVHDVLLDICYG